jgi:hypothetical protein
LVVSVWLGHYGEVRAIDAKHKAKMNKAFVKVFITLLLLSLSHCGQAEQKTKIEEQTHARLTILGVVYC